MSLYPYGYISLFQHYKILRIVDHKICHDEQIIIEKHEKSYL